MKLESLHRMMWRWAACAAMAWLSHTPVLAKPPATMAQARHDGKMPMGMADCPPCAACYLGPVSMPPSVGGDCPGLDAVVSWPVEPHVATVWLFGMPAASIRSAVPLRILHCCWRN